MRCCFTVDNLFDLHLSKKHWVKPSVDTLFAGYYDYQYAESDFRKFIQLRNTNYFLSGMEWLESKNYATAIENFRNYLLEESIINAGQKAETYFYVGIACLELGQSKNAARYFKEVKKNKCTPMVIKQKNYCTI